MTEKKERCEIHRIKCDGYGRCFKCSEEHSEETPVKLSREVEQSPGATYQTESFTEEEKSFVDYKQGACDNCKQYKLDVQLTVWKNESEHTRNWKLLCLDCEVSVKKRLKKNARKKM